MSEEAFRDYAEACKQQDDKSKARRIRTRVTEARSNPHPAGLRWPFELFQNALDAGPRAGRSLVAIHIRRESSKLVFEHDGAPFTSPELAALLSGGSSKEFESEVTTGRFGTGFLVTHVLAERTDLRGLLAAPTGFEEFRLTLDRGGDEAAILENIRSCDQAVRAAKPVDLDGALSARFEYKITESETLDLGFHALRRALPYIYATRPMLGRIVLELGADCTEVWTAEETLRQAIDGGFVEYRTIRASDGQNDLPELRICRFLTEADAAAASMVLIEQTEGGWKVRLPEAGAPRVHREYPLRSSGFVPINFVMDGKFEPDQERSRLLMSPSDKELLSVALRAAVVGVKFGTDQNWKGAHLLARARTPSSAFDAEDRHELKWWTDRLAMFASELAAFPIVECATRFLPAIASNGPTADFVIPRLLPTSTEDETTVERLWPLVDAATDLDPANAEIAGDWTQTAEGWHSLGLRLNRITVSKLAEYVRKDAQRLDQLRVAGPPTRWLAKYLDLVGECWSNRKGVELSALSGMLPNQKEVLRSPGDLQRDDGVSKQLKEVCDEIGLDVRSQLLLDGLTDFVESEGLRHLAETIEKAVARTVCEPMVIHDAIAQLDAALPEEKDCSPDTASLQKASVKLLQYLWKSKGHDAAASAQKIPLVASTLRSVRWTRDRIMMAPICVWHESAREFAGAYPPQRVLADLYAGCGEDVPNVIAALVDWGIAIADPIATDEPSELKGPRLTAIALSDGEGVVVSGTRFSQIALLQPEVLNRCQEGVDEARALLGLVLCYVAPGDPAWLQRRVVKGRKSGDDVEVLVRGALWLADLKNRAWVPVPDANGKAQKMVANKATLQHLLDPAWLENNAAAIKLLSEWFDFDELELRLLGVAPVDSQRVELRNALAKLVESGGADPARSPGAARSSGCRGFHSI
jgi:hypothetical protein